MESHIGVAVAVLDAYDQIADNTHAWAVAKELLVSALGVVLLRLKKLMVKVKIVHLPSLELAGGKQRLHNQVVEPVRRVEIVTPARFRCIGDIGLLEFVHDAEHRI